MNRFVGWAALLVAIPALTTILQSARGDDDAKARSWSPQAVAMYLDQRTEWWLSWPRAARGQGTTCLSCHGTAPYALARPALSAKLGEKGPVSGEQKLINSVRKRVENWESIVTDSKSETACLPFYSGDRKASSIGTEAVLNALVLARNDSALSHHELGAVTKKAFVHLWKHQQSNGAWTWFDFGLNPWETKCEYYGAALAALAVGTAGTEYYEQPGIASPLALLRNYMQTQATGQPLHHRLVAVWASSRLPNLLTEKQKTAFLAEARNLQNADGGWSLVNLGKGAEGNWRSQGVYPPGTVSDGYATGLAVLALKTGGTSADSKTLQAGLKWLTAHEKDGTWPASYPNKSRDPQSDVGKFMRDAGASFAVLALTEPGGEAGRDNGVSGR